MTCGAAIPLICGAQVGTCVTAMISSLGISNNGRRTALMNLYYALLKVIPFMLLFYAVDGVSQPPADAAKAKQRVHTLFRDKYEMLDIGEDEDGRMSDLTDRPAPPAE